MQVTRHPWTFYRIIEYGKQTLSLDGFLAKRLEITLLPSYPNSEHQAIQLGGPWHMVQSNFLSAPNFAELFPFNSFLAQKIQAG